MSTGGSGGEAVSYYDQPVLNPPVWKPEIGWYFFTGGLAGASSVLAAAAAQAGNDALATAAERNAAVGVLVSPPLLIADLGRPERFLNMLRVLKPTSPMSVGSWLLAGYAPLAMALPVLRATHRLPRLQPVIRWAAGAMGAGISSYTAALIADTAVPLWHEGRRELPFVFVGTALATAGAAAAMGTPVDRADGARRATVIGAAIATAALRRLEHRLGPLATPLSHGRAGIYRRAAKAGTVGGSVVVAGPGRRNRAAAIIGGVLVLAGGAAERHAIMRAGRDSAADPRWITLSQQPLPETPRSRTPAARP